MTKATDQTLKATETESVKKTKTVAATKTTTKTSVAAGAVKKAAKKTAARKTAVDDDASDDFDLDDDLVAEPKKRKGRTPTGRKPGRPAKAANNDSSPFDDGDIDIEAEVIPELKPLPKRGGKRGKGDKDVPARNQLTPEEQ